MLFEQAQNENGSQLVILQAKSWNAPPTVRKTDDVEKILDFFFGQERL